MRLLNKKFALFIFIYFLIYGLLAHAHSAHKTLFNEHCDLHFSSGITLNNVPVARSDEEQAHGLSNRNNAGVGMLFMWDVAAPRTFWMHETQIPLIVAFFDAKGNLFASTPMLPNTEALHSSIAPAKYALELSPDNFKKNRFTTGVKLMTLQCAHLPG